MAESPRFLSYVDMPLQHVSRRILASMRRGGDGDAYRKIFEGMRARLPDLSIRSTFIVGFPGEEEKDFFELMSFVKDVAFDNLGVFTYSPEPGSGADALGDPIPFEEKSSRRDVLMEVQQKISLSKNRAKRGKSFDALLEGPSGETEMLLEARIPGQAPEIDGRVLVNEVPEGWAPRVGEIARVTITEAHPYDLVAKIVA
jgi:ribosomal protein S12 methylthiotransferase